MLTQQAIQFIDDLQKNNNTQWMHANQDRYIDYKKDYHNYIASVLTVMQKLDPALAPLEIKNCTFRINRDIRFSKDKQPYKSNIGIWLSTNTNTKNSPGYYIHYEKHNCFIAGGLWCPESAEIKKIRNEIAFFYQDLQNIVNNPAFKKIYPTIDITPATTLKKVPKDYPVNHQAAEFLKLKSYTFSSAIDQSIFTQKNFSSIVASKLIVLQPFNAFLNRALQTND